MDMTIPLALNTPNTLRFTKKLGYHRGNPRLFFETRDIQPFGFVPGASYDIEGYTDSGTHVDRLVITLVTDGKGIRKVCKKAKGARTLSVIDINSAIYMYDFNDVAEVLVTVTHGLINITKLPAVVDGMSMSAAAWIASTSKE